MTEATTPQNWLQNELEAARVKNSRYSLRAMAKKLGLSPGRLSDIMNGRRLLTTQMAMRIADRLGYDPDRREEFLSTVDDARNDARKDARKPRAAIPTAALPAPLKSLRQPKYDPLEMDRFHVIADWYHFAILSLIETTDFNSSPDWISKRLGISIAQAESALERLQSTKLISISSKGRVRSTGKNIETPTDIASTALKRSHRQTLEQAIEAIYEVPVNERDITSMTMAIDSKKIPQAKKLIRNFRKKMAAFLENGPADEVYNLNIQLLPITKRSSRGNA